MMHTDAGGWALGAGKIHTDAMLGEAGIKSTEDAHRCWGALGAQRMHTEAGDGH